MSCRVWRFFMHQTYGAVFFFCKDQHIIANWSNQVVVRMFWRSQLMFVCVLAERWKLGSCRVATSRPPREVQYRCSTTGLTSRVLKRRWLWIRWCSRVLILVDLFVLCTSYCDWHYSCDSIYPFAHRPPRTYIWYIWYVSQGFLQAYCRS